MKNPPAFPGIEGSHASADEYNNRYTAIDSYDGMTLRDYFAAKAMQSAILTFKDGVSKLTPLPVEPEIERVAYVMADAMLKARE